MRAAERATAPGPSVDFDAVARELVRALRGRRSQRSLSRRLGYATNVVHTWEAGARYPGLDAFLHLAFATRPAARSALVAFCAEHAAAQDTESPPAAEIDARWVLQTLRGRRRIAEIAQQMAGNRATLSRWLKGSAEPRLPELLRLVDVATQRLFDFLTVFVDPGALAGAAVAFADHQARLRVAYELPWSHAVLRILELESYRQLKQPREGRIAKSLGISLAEERSCLNALARAGLIRRVRGRWRVTAIMTLDTRRNPDANLRLKRHWAEVGLQRMTGRADGLFLYNLASVSQIDYERLLALQSEYFEQMRAIIRSSEPTERVILANVQLIPLD